MTESLLPYLYMHILSTARRAHLLFSVLSGYLMCTPKYKLILYRFFKKTKKNLDIIIIISLKFPIFLNYDKRIASLPIYRQRRVEQNLSSALERLSAIKNYYSEIGRPR